MQPQRETLLCRYHYDPLDRLADCTPTAQASTQNFYVEKRLATEIQGTIQRSIMQHEDQLLAQQQRQNGTSKSRLLTTDQQRSVLAILDTTRPQHLAYTPYGHRGPESGLLGFNGERPDPVTGHYLLGNGYRAFNPVLMRFNSPDSWSPFGEGGLNAYGYCVGDPVNRSDPTGHIPRIFKPILRALNIIGKSSPPPQKITPLTPATSVESAGASFELVGFHGTSDANAQNLLKNGLEPSRTSKGFFGEGFYTTPDYPKARDFADRRAGKNPHGRLAVYIKKPSEKIQGQHYTFHPGEKGTIDELRLLPPIYKDVKFLQFDSTGYTPEININAIFRIRSSG